MNDARIPSMSAAVCKVIDGYPLGHQFHLNELHDDVARLYPDAQRMYTDTVGRMMRRHRRFAVIVVDQNNSLYEKICRYDPATGQGYLL